jgi:hypothetical protein
MAEWLLNHQRLVSGAGSFGPSTFRQEELEFSMCCYHVLLHCMAHPHATFVAGFPAGCVAAQPPGPHHRYAVAGLAQSWRKTLCICCCCVELTCMAEWLLNHQRLITGALCIQLTSPASLGMKQFDLASAVVVHY